ncbi:MAG: 50S ribosomal protein L17 [Saprospiraceae bacterium]|nr:50S ribosomal protein L17 [Candidatus Opimibacter iunctus]
MRHGKTINHLSRKAGHRAALLMNLSLALIQHKRIFTTVAKAKALKKHIEPLITKSKSNTTHNRRVVFSYLNNKEAVTELFSTVAAKVATRPGGYTRVIRTGFRKGDGAEMAMIELVDFNEIYTNTKKRRSEKSAASETKTRRTRRGKAKTGVTTATAAPAATAAAAASEEE